MNLRALLQPREPLALTLSLTLSPYQVNLGLLSNLESLSLDSNRLSDAESKLLTPVCKLSALKVLSLCGNRLTEVPAAIGQLRSLQELLLRGDLLNELPTAPHRLSSAPS